MEVRSQEKGTVMPSSLGYNPPNRDSSSKIPSASIISAFGERKTLENHPLYHHHQLNLQHQSLKPTRDSGLTPNPPPPPPPHSAPSRSISRSPPPPPPPPPPSITTATSITITTTTTSVRYRECLKNHAASMGGLVVDGCGEFMPSGEEGTPEALKCAACECHRNFHRKEIDGEPQCTAPSSNCYYKNINNLRKALPQQLAASLPSPSQPPVHHQNYRYHHGFSVSASTAPIAPMMMTFGGGGGDGGAPAESSSEDLNMFRSNLQGHGSIQPSLLSKKRFRTKFSQEQKDKMMEFAEKIGWKIQKQDEQEVQQFCSNVGVKRKVFKVWMHNNNQATKKKEM